MFVAVESVEIICMDTLSMIKYYSVMFGGHFRFCTIQADMCSVSTISYAILFVGRGTIDHVCSTLLISWGLRLSSGGLGSF